MKDSFKFLELVFRYRDELTEADLKALGNLEKEWLERLYRVKRWKCGFDGE